LRRSLLIKWVNLYGYVSLIPMKTKVITFIAALLIAFGISAQEKPVKMSNSDICHAPNTTYYGKS